MHSYSAIATHGQVTSNIANYVYIVSYIHASVLEITVDHWLFPDQFQHSANQNLFQWA